MDNYIQKIVEDFNFNSIHDDNNKTGSFVENVLGVVDLGLPSGTLWCKCNLGANTEIEYGDYYAWGELTTKNEYTKDNYTYKDPMSQLPPERDVATQTLGKNYSIPTTEQFEELITYTKNKWIKNYKGTGINGMVFKGKNGKSIFIPAAGHCVTGVRNEGTVGCLWTSNLNVKFPDNTYFFYFCNGYVQSMFDSYRYNGQTIRPVFNKK